MLRKSLMLGSSLALALAVAGPVFAGERDGGDDGEGGYGRVHCPAKSEARCDRKGGDFDYKWIHGYKVPTCTVEEHEFVKCRVDHKLYKAKIEEITTWIWLDYKKQCPSYEKTKIKKCWKLGYDYKWYPAKDEDCKPCLEDDDSEHGGDGKY